MIAAVVVGLLAGGTLALLLLVLADVHAAGIGRLHAALEPVPWWLPHHVEDCPACQVTALVRHPLVSEPW